MGQREAALRLDGQWAGIRSGEREAAYGEAEALLGELIAALRGPAGTDPECAARLGLRLGDLAARRFAGGDRAGALAAVEEGLGYVRRAAGYSPQYARWYARLLINQGVWLAWPLSGPDRLPLHPLGAAAEDGPGAMERAAGERALDLTRTAVGVWSGLDQEDPVNRRGLAQALVFLGDRLAELGLAEEAVARAVEAEGAFRALLLADPGSAGAADAEEALDHIGRQLELRLRFLSFGSLVGLRARGLLPGRLLPQAVVAARIQGVPEEELAARLHLGADQVRTMLEVTPWRAVWRFEARGADGLWEGRHSGWQGSAELRNRTAEEFGAELVRGFRMSSRYPGDGTHWRLRVWWHEEGDPAGARFRLLVGPDARGGGPETTPS
ncbi:hypothetical protein ACIO7M_29500 [Streptomyces toxytricini]|uniref:Uncharacterized protein n=1 Tax=Streptomyces toxytricini TaxID=67369 RepID=A0ABW8ET00_STRT5